MNALLSSRIVGLTAAIALLAVNLSAEPAWAPNKAYSVGARVVYADKLYQCIQSHTSQSTWTPPATPALWVRPEPAACSSW